MNKGLITFQDEQCKYLMSFQTLKGHNAHPSLQTMLIAPNDIEIANKPITCVI